VSLALPATWKIILYVGGALLGVIALYFLKRTLLPWFQRAQDSANQAEVEAARKTVEGQNTAANEESDKLRDIEGR
jgi:uncharacterized SAM-binding protein YcdF (DUF218 family)